MSVKNGINGWAGSILRINLSTGAITTEDTLPKYKPYMGGMGIGYKVILDEVPLTTKAYDEANKIIFSVGPLTARLHQDRRRKSHPGRRLRDLGQGHL